MNTIKENVFVICKQIYYPSEENIYLFLSISNFSSIPIKISNIKMVFDFNRYHFNDLTFIINSGKQSERRYQFCLPHLDREKNVFSKI
jgi:hypothetical protein